VVVKVIEEHKSYQYALSIVNGEINAPKFVIMQCQQFIYISDGKDDKYMIDEDKVDMIDNLLKLMKMAKGLDAGSSVYDVIAGFQSFFIIAVLCTIYRDNPKKRRYETAILEICRKNGKTWLINIIFLLLFLLEPKFSKFYSVAPDGSLSREVREAIKETISVSPALSEKFKIRRDDIECKITDNKYIPLNYSTSRLDGKLPAVFLVDETGALPNPYAIEAMRSGQLTILNKLGCIISTKYPTIDNPFEDEVLYAKKVLSGLVDDDKVFALLYEPDNTKDWMNDDNVLEQANPLALEVPEIMEDLKSKRQVAIEVASKRENFVTKHCNIVFQGIGTESYVDINDLKKCKSEEPIDWAGRNVYLSLDLAMTTDNCAVAMVSEEDGKILADAFAFIPAERIEEKNRSEKINYYEFIESKKCFPCGDMTVDYGFIEDFIMNIEQKFGVNVIGLAYDRFNCLSTAQRIERETEFKTVEVKQHSSVLHPATKMLQEKIINQDFVYSDNKLLEINMQNSKCTQDTNLNMYVNKKRSNGKVDMTVALINAVYLMAQDIIFNPESDWGAMVI
jgi:phage terminase large subunit-like protein